MRNLLFVRAHDELCTGGGPLLRDGCHCEKQTESLQTSLHVARTSLLRLPAGEQKPNPLRGRNWGTAVSRAAPQSRRGRSFTRKYRVKRLVWYQTFESVGNAIAWETEIKAWRREKKVALICENNPTWEDLAADWVSRSPSNIMALPAKSTHSPPPGCNTGGHGSQPCLYQPTV